MTCPVKPTTALALEEAKANKQLNSSSYQHGDRISINDKSQRGGAFPFPVSLRSSKSGHKLSPGTGIQKDSMASTTSHESGSKPQQEKDNGSLTIEEARAHIADFLGNTNRLGLHIHNYPTFDARELMLGKWLGRGGFSNVEEIRQFLHIPKATRLAASASTTQENTEPILTTSGSDRGSPLPEELGYTYEPSASSDHYSDPSLPTALSLGPEEETNRQFIVKNCLRDSGETRYAIKYLRKEIACDPKQYPSGAMDLAIEALFLADLQHPNIIKLRGISTADPFSQDKTKGNFYFLIMDRLRCTLTDRMKVWRERRRRLNTLVGRITDISGRKRQTLLDERLAAAYDLSAAVNYLETQRILHRDLKPDNIGFDIRGDIKIFDFGLARELRESDRDPDNEGMFRLSNMTGSFRYMAPEVGIDGTPYNSKADVYSFTIVLWEMLSLQRAYMDAGPTHRSFTESVFVKQTRPVIKHTWSRTVQSLLTQGWCHDPKERLTAEQCQDMLRNELVNMRHGDDTELDHVRRRSTYVMEDETQQDEIQSQGVPGTYSTRRSASTSDVNASFATQPPRLPWAVKPTRHESIQGPDGLRYSTGSLPVGRRI